MMPSIPDDERRWWQECGFQPFEGSSFPEKGENLRLDRYAVGTDSPSMIAIHGGIQRDVGTEHVSVPPGYE